MKARFIGESIGRWDALTQPGDIAVGAENYHRDFMARCPICDDLHVVPIEGHNPWEWDKLTLTLSPSVKVNSHRGICHWNLTNGEFIIHGDSTATPDIAVLGHEERSE